VLCIQPVIRLLLAADVELSHPDGIQWCGLAPTLWTLPGKVKEAYRDKGFHFDEDRSLLETLSRAGEGGEEDER
jgi:hypothetical protein